MSGPLPPSQALVASNGLTVAGVALPVPVGEVEIRQLPARLLGLSRPVTLSGQVVAQDQGSATLRTAAGDVVLRTSTPLPTDRPLTLQIPGQTAGAVLPRAQIYAPAATTAPASPSPAPAPQPATGQPSTAQASTGQTSTGQSATPPSAGTQPVTSPPSAPVPSASPPATPVSSAPQVQPGASLPALVLPAAPRPPSPPAASQSDGRLPAEAPMDTAPAAPGLGLILAGGRATGSGQQGQPSIALPTPAAAPAAPAAPVPAQAVPQQAAPLPRVPLPEGSAAATPDRAPGPVMPGLPTALPVQPPGPAPIAASRGAPPVSAEPATTGPQAGAVPTAPVMDNPGPAKPAVPASPGPNGPSTATSPAVAPGPPAPGTASANRSVPAAAPPAAGRPDAPAPAPVPDGLPPPSALATTAPAMAREGAGWRGVLTAAGRLLGLDPAPPPRPVPPTAPPPSATPVAQDAASAPPGQPPRAGTTPAQAGAMTAALAAADPAVPARSIAPRPTLPTAPQSQPAQTVPAAVPAVLSPGSVVQVRVLALTPPGLTLPMTDMAGPAPLAGTVLATTTTGQPVVATAQGTLVLQGQADLTPGTVVALEILEPPPVPARPVPALDPRHGGDWPALREMMEVLAGTDPALARTLAHAVLPQPNRRLTTNLLFFLSALRGGDAGGWLGEATTTALDRGGQGALLNRLIEDFRAIAQQAAEPLPDGWRAYAVPFGEPGQIGRLQLYVRAAGDDEEQATAARRGAPRRFLVEVSFSQLGPMQLDGLLQARRLDLAVRTLDLLPATLTAELSALFRTSLDATGFTGSIAFQTGAQRWARLHSARGRPVQA